MERNDLKSNNIHKISFDFLVFFPSRRQDTAFVRKLLEEIHK